MHPRELQELFDALLSSGRYHSLGDLNRVLADRVRGYNARPQGALGGLSPDEMAILLYGDWREEGALRLTEDLPAAELSGAAILADARTLLTYVREQGPVKETAAGNLPRAVVASLLPSLRMLAQPESAVPLPPMKVVNEDDILWLSVLRHTLTFGGLLIRRKGFRITARGRVLLAEERSGELYATLFRTLFRKLDLRALDRWGEQAGLQSTVAFSFYKLRSCAQAWSSPDTLAGSAWLETAQDPPTEWQAAHGDFRSSTFRHRVLTPLVHFGLLEERRLPSEDWWHEPVEVRVTPLFDRFLRFDLGTEWSPASSRIGTAHR
jgi:hypothetical protein